MNSNRVFQVTLIISALVHTGFIVTNPHFAPLLKNPKKDVQVEITYVKKPEQKFIPQINKENLLSQKDFLSKIPDKITVEKKLPPPFIDKDEFFKKNRQSVMEKELLSRPELPKTEAVAFHKKVTMPPVGLEKANNPSYISYYQLVREKIRRAAYQNYIRTEIGEVYLSFVIGRDGGLKDVRLISERSSSSKYLQDISLNSVGVAAPFPVFPKELDYPELSFNVEISFEVE